VKSQKRALLAIAAMCSLCAIVAVPASAAYKQVGSFANNPAEENGSGSADGQLSNPNQVAVNVATGKLYVADTGNNRVEVFRPTATAAEYDSQVGISAPTGVAIDQATGDVYVANATGIAKYDSALNPIVLGWADPAVTGTLAVDPSSGDLLVADQSANLIRRFEADGTPVSTIAAERPLDLDANAAGEVFVVTSTGDIVNECFSATSSVQRFSAAGVDEGTVGSLEMPGAIAVDPDDNAIAVATHVAGYNCPGPKPAIAILDSSGVEVEAVELPYEYGFVSGLAAAGGSSSRLYAVVRSPLNDFYVPTRIVVLEEPQPAVPQITTGGSPYVSATSARLAGSVDPNLLETTYWIEYGTGAGYGSRFPVGHDAQAGNGEDPEGVTLQIEGLSPATTYHYRFAAKNSLGEAFGADRTFTTGSLIPPPPSGRAFELVSPVEKSGNPVIQDNGANLMVAQASADGSQVFYAGRGAFSPADPAGFLRNVYAADRVPGGWSSRSLEAPFAGSPQLVASTVRAISADGARSLVQSTSVLASGAVAGGANLYLRDNRSGVYDFVATLPFNGESPIVGATDDLSHFVFGSAASLTADAPSGAISNLYERSPSGLRLVSYMPDGTPAADGALPQPFEAFERYRPNFISSDGSRVLFEAAASTGLSAGLYLREHADRPPSPVDGGGNCTVPTDACTIPISFSQRSGDVGEVAAARLSTASEDGRLVYFTSSNPLTEDSETGGGTSLYRFDVASGELTDLTVPTAGSSNGVNTQVLGAAEDGSTVYFADDAVLVPGATQGDCQSGICNIWTWHEGDIALVGTLKGPSAGLSLPGSRSVSPNGRYMAFLSTTNALDLGGQDTDGPACPANVPACAEVFVYDAAQDRLSCTSCPTPGAAPQGSAQLGAKGVFGEASIGHLRRFVLDDGTVFFDSPDGLVSTDSNGSYDVYEWRDGERRLISPGAVDADAHFADAAADGSSVFFTTPESLVARDVDPLADLYVARAGGGFAEPPPPPLPCQGEACQGLPAPAAVQGAPGSATLRAQSHRKQKRHHARKKSKHSKKHHKKANRTKAPTKHNRGGAK